MAAARERKRSKFLVELDKYYCEREKLSNSFVDTPCPQNFIPGATKAKSNVKFVRAVSRKMSSICYRGVVVQVKDNMTAVEKGVIPGGLLAVAFPSPSQHTSCLEHKMEQIFQRNSRLFSSVSSKADDATVDEEVTNEEDKILLESMSAKQRSCSLPATSKDIGALPIISYDDHYIVAEFGDVIDHKRDRSNSYPLATDDLKAYTPQPMGSRKYDNFAFDSATRLGALCRGMSYYGSPFDSSMHLKRKKKKIYASSQEEDIAEWSPVCDSNSDKQRNMSDESLEESEAKSAGEVDDLEKGTDEVPTEDIKEEELREKKYFSDPEQHTYSIKPKRSSGKLKSIRKRLSRKKNNKNKDDSDIVMNTSKETLTQIQDVLRAKLPKTFQTTVKVGLSFDPVTVKERNARGTDTLPPPKANKNRSRSLTNSPQLMRGNGQLRGIGNNSGVPSLVVSPPTGNEEMSGNDSAGLLTNFLRLGKDTLTRKIDRLGYKRRKDVLRSSSSTNIELFQSFSERRAKKLENLLGAEFGELYCKQRSNSLPSIGHQRVLMAKFGNNQPRSTLNTGNEEGISCLPSAFDVWSSCDTSDSDASCMQKGSEKSYESELSDYDELDVVNTDNIAANSESEQTNVISSTPVIMLLQNGKKGRANDEKFTDTVDQQVRDQGDGKQVQNNGVGDVVSSDEDVQNSTMGSNINSQKTNRESDGVSKFRVETSFVLSKSTLLKSSKELMEESKGNQLDSVGLVKKPMKTRQNRKHGVEEKKESEMASDSNNMMIRKLSRRVQNNNEERVFMNRGDGEDKSGVENGKFRDVAATETCIDKTYEDELKELDSLLAELEIYAMN